MSANVKDVTDADFAAEVLKSDLPTLVDFWAPWCGPCRMVGPVIEELAKEYAGKVKFVKLNTDESQNTAVTYRIRSIPSLMLFKGGEVAEALIGAQPKDKLTAFLGRHI